MIKNSIVTVLALVSINACAMETSTKENKKTTVSATTTSSSTPTASPTIKPQSSPTLKPSLSLELLPIPLDMYESLKEQQNKHQR